jgi:hypothetical protein
MGVDPADLLTLPTQRPPAPTVAAHIPIVTEAVPADTRRAYSSYWKRVHTHWADKRLDEITASDVRALTEHVKTHAVVRRNPRGGRNAAENLIAALRCLYRHAHDNGLIDDNTNPAHRVDKPRRLPSTRRAPVDGRERHGCARLPVDLRGRGAGATTRQR